MIRWMTIGDYHEITQMDGRMTATRLKNLSKKHTGMVVEKKESIVGYMFYRFNANQLDIIEFFVDPIYRRMGIGSEMMAKLVTKIDKQKRNCMEILVEDDDLDMHLFLKEMGFTAKVHSEDNSLYIFRYCLPVLETC